MKRPLQDKLKRLGCLVRFWCCILGHANDSFIYLSSLILIRLFLSTVKNTFEQIVLTSLGGFIRFYEILSCNKWVGVKTSSFVWSRSFTFSVTRGLIFFVTDSLRANILKWTSQFELFGIRVDPFPYYRCRQNFACYPKPMMSWDVPLTWCLWGRLYLQQWWRLALYKTLEFKLP